MKYTCVLPWVIPHWRDDCMRDCKLDVHQIDNSEVNRGVPRSWNMGIDRMIKDDSDWLIVMSAAVRFGEPGGLDFLKVLEHHSDHRAVSALGLFGWHLMAFSRETIETAGRFDENFFPAYYEDVDYSIRMYRVKPDAPWGAYAIDAKDAGMAHTLELARTYIDNRMLLDYFAEKWGVSHGHEWHEYNDHPFADATNPIQYWPDAYGGSWDQPASEAL